MYTACNFKKVLLISFIVITGYMIVEAIGGFLTISPTLLSDAGHKLTPIKKVE